MSVEYDAAGSQSQEREEFQLHDKEAIVRFAPFSRTQDGDLVVSSQPEFEFYQEDDQWFRRGATRDEGSTPVLESEVIFWDTVYYQFEIVAYLERDGSPGREHLGKHLPYGSKLKGIKTYKDDAGKWWFKMPGLGFKDSKYRTGLFVVAEKCGFDIQALNPESGLYSPEYIADEMAALESPLGPEQIIEKVIEPKLLAAAESGLLLQVHTNANSNWVQYGSITTLSPEQAARYHEQAASEDTKVEGLRTKVREMAKGAGPDFATQVYKLALQVQADVDKDDVLVSSTASTLEFVLQALGESEPAEASL